MRCLVIEDEAETARYVCSRLEEVGHAAVRSGDGVDGLKLATQDQWDVIILDRMLPGQMDGLSLLRKLREAGKSTPVLILSALASVDDKVTGLSGGCDDYLTKPFAFEELHARLEALLRRSTLREELTELRVGDLKLDLLTRKAERANRKIALQPLEFRVLEFLVRRQGQVVTRAMLLEGVWNYRLDPETGVIEVQISRLRQKVDKDFDQPLIHTVRGSGYMVALNE